MKYILAMSALCAIGLSCCTKVPPVPPTTRTVVPPKGSTEIEKAWGGVTEKEAEAILPFNTMRR